ncbi:MAG TPA: hypothetical protein VGI41_04460 [Candidatus Udaeobacter sp.]|jgi:hypothetical protein
MNLERLLSVAGWVVPSAILLLIPKCPVCLAAYVAAWTGLGQSVSAATNLRAWLLIFSAGLLAFVAARSWMRVTPNAAHETKCALAETRCPESALPFVVQLN